MRDLKIEDLRAGVKLLHKHRNYVMQIDEVDIDDNMILYMDGQWDYITGDYGILDDYYLLEDTKNEVEELIESRNNGTYNQISDDASAIIATLGTDEYAYFFSQIANKLARIKHGYSVEDSLLDIAGYAKLELDKFRGGDNNNVRSNEVKIHFFDTINECYIDDSYSDPNYSSDLAVNDDGNVFNIKTHFLRPYIEPHYYQDGERIA